MKRFAECSRAARSEIISGGTGGGVRRLMKVASISTIFGLAILLCTGCLTYRYAEHGKAFKYTDFKPYWDSLRPDGAVAIEGVCDRCTTDTSCFILLGQIPVNGGAVTNKDEAVQAIDKYVLDAPCQLSEFTTASLWHRSISIEVQGCNGES